ncbi:MAG: glycosyltransferase family 2 protein [Actinomycetota bacterium]
MRAAIIIPAFNESARITTVLQSLEGLPAEWLRIVVNDGSTDDTAEVAGRFQGVTVLSLPENRGKGAAMWAGALEADAEALIFLDADLRGLTPPHVQALAAPVLAGQAVMTVALFRGGRGATDFSHVITPWVSGQRCILRDQLLALPEVRGSRLGVELLLTQIARRRRWPVVEVRWAGVTHAMKEEKLGVLRGHLARWQMYHQMWRVFINTLTPATRARHLDCNSRLPAKDTKRVLLPADHADRRG